MHWGRKWKCWPCRNRSLGLDPAEWQTWLSDQYERAARRLHDDVASGRISRTTFYSKLDELEKDYEQASRRHPLRAA
jgi:hypothetical protein